MLYVLVNAPLRVLYVNYCTRGVGREVHIARGEAEWYMKLRDLPPSAIIYVEYERIRCINWFVVWKRVPGSQLALKKRHGLV